ncbi:MAG: hypothetical protein ACE5OY_05550 [Candidatus Bathyarchaeia archaeon]
MSFYGSEEEFLSPEDFVKKDDAEDALSRAKKALEFCNRLLSQYKKR